MFCFKLKLILFVQRWKFETPYKQLACNESISNVLTLANMYEHILSPGSCYHWQQMMQPLQWHCGDCRKRCKPDNSLNRRGLNASAGAVEKIVSGWVNFPFSFALLYSLQHTGLNTPNSQDGHTRVADLLLGFSLPWPIIHRWVGPLREGRNKEHTAILKTGNHSSVWEISQQKKIPL